MRSTHPIRYTSIETQNNQCAPQNKSIFKISIPLPEGLSSSDVDCCYEVFSSVFLNLFAASSKKTKAFPLGEVTRKQICGFFLNQHNLDQLYPVRHNKSVLVRNRSRLGFWANNCHERGPQINPSAKDISRMARLSNAITGKTQFSYQSRCSKP